MPTAPELEWSQPAPEPRFYADNNVHRLGRGLRTLGYDTKLYGEGPDDRLREFCKDENRILLSCDADFEGESGALVLISDDWQEQLKIVVLRFSLDPVNYRYSLCLNCNCRVHRADPYHYSEQVPAWVHEENSPLWRCPQCRRLFWAGSHLERMNARYDKLFDFG